MSHFCLHQIQISLLIFCHVHVIFPGNLLKSPDVWCLSTVKDFLCLLCCFNVKTYFLRSLSHESPTKVSWIANLTPLDPSFQFLLFILNTTTRNALTC